MRDTNNESEQPLHEAPVSPTRRAIFLIISAVAVGAIVMWIVSARSRAIELQEIEETARKLIPEHGHRVPVGRRSPKGPSEASRARIRRLAAAAWREIDEEVDREMRAEGWDIE